MKECRPRKKNLSIVNYWATMSKLSCCILVMVTLLRWAESLPEPFLCSEPECETEKCRHMDRSGLCDEVAKGQLELTTQNCGCCFLCSDRKPDPELLRVITGTKDVNDKFPFFINFPLTMQAVVQLNATPGTPVFKLQARDPDTNPDIHYFLVRDMSGGRFEIDESTGEVRTLGSDPFILGKEYVLIVKAEDHNGMTEDRQYQSTGEERVSIMGGNRAPQFYMQNYTATIPENQSKDADIIEVKAKSFSDREIRYIIRAVGRGAGTFNIGPTTGVVSLAKDLDYEDLRQFKTYWLIVTATEDSTGFSTNVELIIHVADVNDNAPRFKSPEYQAHNVDEDVAVGTSILRVSASDLDMGKNAEIEYSLDNDVFTIDNEGFIYSNKRLDADIDDMYVLTVRATDRGDPPLTGTATVSIHMENKNDEAPRFTQNLYTSNVDRNAGPNTLVTTVAARDIDGDNIYFGFLGGGTFSKIFRIDERTGVIRLINGTIQLDEDKYQLNVTARDDGACCKNGSFTTHTTLAVVVVYIMDPNDNNPLFKECVTYAPRVEEGAPRGTQVITVKAVDNDKGYSGRVRYSIMQQPNEKEIKFIVDQVTGDISTNKVFDREGDDGCFVRVIVKAKDRGDPPLQSVCSILVEITDVNDNPPLFDRQEYRENLKNDTPIGTNILRLSASDEDVGNNGVIVYNLTAPFDPTDLEFFDINPDSGWISLKKVLHAYRDMYVLHAIALDKGLPQHRTKVEVIIDVVDTLNNPPIWDQPVYGPIFIKENYEIGEVVASIKARSDVPDNPTVFYTLIKGSTEQTNKKDTFYLDQRLVNGDTWVDIKVNHPLDYERIQQYNLTVRVEDNGVYQLASETTVYIVVEDVEDEIPLFIEREMPTNTKVQDADTDDDTEPNNQEIPPLTDQLGVVKETKRPCVYHELITFLQAVYGQTEPSPPLDMANNDKSETPIARADGPAIDAEPPSRMPKQSKSHPFEREILQILHANVRQDNDVILLLSQLPCIRKLKKTDKLQFQIQFLQLIQQYSNECENTEVSTPFPVNGDLPSLSTTTKSSQVEFL